MRTILSICLLVLVPLALGACKTKTTTVDSCGDGVVDPGEDCEGDVGEHTCASLGYYNVLGELTCKSDCTFDVSFCGGHCGDSLVEADNDEVCDAANLAGATCLTRGYYGGELACSSDCRGFNEAGCADIGRCGDGLLQETFGEVCDQEELGGETCEGLGFYGGALRCQDDCRGYLTHECAGRCGDGQLQADAGEVCDGGDLGGATCVSLGYHGGTLACNAHCDEFDLTSCVAAGRCGDSVVQAAAGEACDGTNYNNATCQSLGFYQGSLACDGTCQLDTSGCSQRCGDGTIQAAYGEVCDGTNLGGQTCVTQGYLSGQLVCSPDCRAFNIAGCTGQCGDGTIQSAFGEVCDGTNLGGQTCVTKGYYGGSLACEGTCTAFDLASCVVAGRCGDGAVQISYGEDCDGSNLNGQTCVSRGYYTGTLSCTSGCDFNLAGCSGRCGDGTVQSTYGEYCDGTNLNGQTCQTLGYYTGNLSCSAACALISTGCSGRCGDGTVQSAYGEDCDGSNLNSKTCASLGYIFGGTLSCAANCDFVETSCLEAADIANGAQHTCALSDGGAVKCWGRNNTSQLGDGTTTDRSNPVAVTGITTATGVSAGTGHTCVRLENSTIKCWGLNDVGQLGDGSTVNRAAPTLVSGISTAVGVYAHGKHTCALLSDQTVKCWGLNTGGQLGDNSTTNRSTPVAVLNLTGVVALSGGPISNHTCAVKSNGSAYCWGVNNNGQLGDGTTTNRSLPAQVLSVSTAQSISAGYLHSCVRLADGTVSCWGNNASGQLGDGTTTSRSVSGVIHGLTGVTGVRAGGYHTCALLSSGSMMCWGANESGQLGVSGTSTKTTPTTVIGSNFFAFSAGGNHTCALIYSGKSAKCWGSNTYGQLGDGTTTTRTTPVPVVP